jgi:hypothetical protein
MKGFQAVFAMLVPLIAICLLGSFFVSDETLKGDEKKNDRPTRTPAVSNPYPLDSSHTEKAA